MSATPLLKYRILQIHKALADMGNQPRAITVIGDLGDQVVVDKIVATAIEVHRGLDVLINNARGAFLLNSQTLRPSLYS